MNRLHNLSKRSNSLQESSIVSKTNSIQECWRVYFLVQLLRFFWWIMINHKNKTKRLKSYNKSIKLKMKKVYLKGKSLDEESDSWLWCRTNGWTNGLMDGYRQLLSWYCDWEKYRFILIETFQWRGCKHEQRCVNVM